MLGRTIYYNTTTGDWEIAKSDSMDHKCQGIVVEARQDDATVALFGHIDWKHGLTLNKWYYLATGGGYTSIPPPTGIVQPLLYTLEADYAYVYVGHADVAGFAASPTFQSLPDTPATYTGSGGYNVKVKAKEDGLEFERAAVTYVVDTIAERNALPNINQFDQCWVTRDPVPANNGLYLATVDNPTAGQWFLMPTSGASNYLSLTDTPGTYTGPPTGGRVARPERR